MNEDHKDAQHSLNPLDFHNGTSRSTMHQDPCYIQRGEFDSFKRELTTTCELHRKEIELMVEHKCQEVGNEASEDLSEAVCISRDEMNESLAGIGKRMDSLDSKIDALNVKQEIKWNEYHKEQRDFNRNMIIALVGIIATMVIGFISLWFTTRGII